MGYTTDFTGSVTIEPPLNSSEIDYLRRFADSRRFSRTDGPYALHEDGLRGPRVVDYNRTPDGQPSLWCNWVPTGDGSAIEWNGQEKFYDSVEWMQYLIDTFLRAGAVLQDELASPVPGRFYDDAFTAFTFDHTVGGTIEAEGEDPDDVWRLVVADGHAERVEVVEPEVAPVAPGANVERRVHFVRDGVSAVCEPAGRGERALHLAFDPDDDSIDCPFCRLYVKGLRAGRGGA